MSTRRGVVLAIALGATFLVSACSSDPSKGYAMGWTYDENVRSVAVPMFDNSTFDTGLEFDLTEAIIAEIQSQTPWVVTANERADTTLTGAITGAQARNLSSTPGTGLVQENAYELRVSFRWRDNRSGDVLVARDGFSAVGTYVPARGTGERREIGQRQAIRELAREIVAELRSNW
ncbi:MAG: LptE family protein [Phycisphaerales bacterium]